MSDELSPDIKFPNGKQAILLNPDGSGFAYYSTGQPALCLNRIHAGIYSIFYHNDKRNSVLCSFDPTGVGSATFPDGKPRLINEATRGSLSDEKGHIIKDWDYKHPNKEWIEFPLNNNLYLRFLNAEQIFVRYQCEGVSREFQIGHVLKYTKNYLDKVEKRETIGQFKGKCILAVEGRCRAAADAYNQRAVQNKNVTDMDLKQIFAHTKAFGESVKRGDYHVKPFIEKDMQAKALESVTKDDIALGFLAAEFPANVGSRMDHFLQTRNPVLPVSSNLKNASGRYRSFEGGPIKCSRRKLPLIKLSKGGKAFENFIENEVKRDQLIAVCCLAHWNPTSRKMETLLEDAYGMLSAEYNNQVETTAPYRMVKVEMSESRYLNDKYNITTVPIYLFYYGGKLVFANNHFNKYGNTPGDFLAQLKTSLQDAQSSKFLPEGFSFGLTSDTITNATNTRMEDAFKLPANA
eukprot:GFYU01007439.1.p1 GENE.GFYU01007439.1~~GFYU01007439.1.p1  ORF type:complete len:463 (-),score=144.94 GFYU01007439.1:40-1428(-)